MRRLLLILLTLVPALAASAQQTQVKYGYFSYQEAFTSMPDYAVCHRKIEDLRIKYDEEMKRVEDEFNTKYELFLEGQRDFAPSILQKRQAELQDLIEKNMAFREEAKRLLAEAEKETYAPLRQKLSEVLRGIGDARGYLFILNTDSDAVPYMSMACGEDISTLIKESLR